MSPFRQQPSPDAVCQPYLCSPTTTAGSCHDRRVAVAGRDGVESAIFPIRIPYRVFCALPQQGAGVPTGDVTHDLGRFPDRCRRRGQTRDDGVRAGFVRHDRDRDAIGQDRPPPAVTLPASSPADGRIGPMPVRVTVAHPRHRDGCAVDCDGFPVTPAPVAVRLAGCVVPAVLYQPASVVAGVRSWRSQPQQLLTGRAAVGVLVPAVRATVVAGPEVRPFHDPCPCRL